jgi:16S rRNA processing protein RimM
MPFKIIGYVGKPIGLEGKFYISAPRFDAQIPGSLKYIYVGSDTGPENVLTIEALEERSGRLCVSVKEIRKREAAEKLRHKTLFIPEDQAVPLTGSQNQSRCKGYEVWQDDTFLGTVTGTLELPMQDTLVVTGTNGTEVMIPFVGEFIRSIDDKAGKLHVKLLEGMLDED